MTKRTSRHSKGTSRTAGGRSRAGRFKRTSKRRTSKRRTSKTKNEILAPKIFKRVQTQLLKTWDRLHLVAGSMSRTNARKADKAASLLHSAYMTLGRKHVVRRRR